MTGQHVAAEMMSMQGFWDHFCALQEPCQNQLLRRRWIARGGEATEPGLRITWLCLRDSVQSNAVVSTAGVGPGPLFATENNSHNYLRMSAAI